MATIIEMPKLSDTMSVGTLVTWLKKEGDKVSSGDKIAEIETDKATMEMEVFEDGVLLKQIVAVGEQVAVGAPICAIGKPGEKVDVPAKSAATPPPAANLKSEISDSKSSPAPAPAPVPAATSATRPAPIAAPAPAAADPGDRQKISPLARKVAAELGVDATGVSGTGPGGRIVRADIEAAAARPPAANLKSQISDSKSSPAGKPAKAAPSAPPFVGTSEAAVQDEKSVPASNMRKTIATRLVESKVTVPHFYLEIEVDVGPLLALRTQVNEAFGESAKLSVNDFILKACAHALRRVPGVNSSWMGTAIQQHGAAHISFAVAIEDGLITPVIFNAHAKSVFQISQEAKALGAKAKAKKLQPNEFSGGTFCVSNLGMFGIQRFQAIINPPNGAILAVGTTVKKPVVNDKDEIVIGQRMALTLSCDHRVVDGALGAQFLSALKDILEKPLLVLG